MCTTEAKRAIADDIEQLRANIEELALFAGTTVAEVERVDERVTALADKTAQGLAHLAVAIVELSRPSRWARAKQWFRDNVYDGTPIPLFTHVPEQDDRRL